MTLEQLQDGIFWEKTVKSTMFWTKSLVPGQQVYGERLRESGAYRQWIPNKSKLAAALLKGVRNIQLKKGDCVLYLGASSGTTVSHISDIVGEKGMVFSVEFSFQMMRNLVFLAETRKNIAPILADANHPEQYMPFVCEVDFLYQDIAQKNQAEIFLKNLQFLKNGGQGVLCVKARSVDITAQPKSIYMHVRRQLEKEVTIIAEKQLDPFEKDHCVFLVEK
jgi:fibrillarin-like pre-rRNA processing protein